MLEFRGSTVRLWSMVYATHDTPGSIIWSTCHVANLTRNPTHNLSPNPVSLNSSQWHKSARVGRPRRAMSDHGTKLCTPAVHTTAGITTDHYCMGRAPPRLPPGRTLFILTNERASAAKSHLVQLSSPSAHVAAAILEIMRV